MLNIKINQVKDYIALHKASKTNMLIVGDPGIGKSTITRQLQNLDGEASERCKVTMLTGSSTYEETVNGIPYRDNEQTSKFAKNKALSLYTVPSWLEDMLAWQEQNKDGWQVLFIDEFNTAEPQVLKTFLSILTERIVPTHPDLTLPENTVIVAAMNPPQQNDGETLIRPLASRYATYRVKASLEDFEKYIIGAKDKDEYILPLVSSKTNLNKTQVSNILRSISPTAFNTYDETDFETSCHEVNPRSISNMLTALTYCANAQDMLPKLSQAFLGITIATDLSATQKQTPRKNGFMTAAEAKVATDKELENEANTIKEVITTNGMTTQTNKALTTILQELANRGRQDIVNKITGETK